MGFLKVSKARGLVLLALLGIGNATLVGKDGRDFAGFYSVSNTTEQGNQVRITFSLQLFNYSGADLRQAAAILRESPPGTGVFGTSAPIELWRNGTDTIIVLHLSVPREELERWGARRQPTVIVINRDDQGREWQRTAQVSHRAMIPLEGSSATQ